MRCGGFEGSLMPRSSVVLFALALVLAVGTLAVGCSKQRTIQVDQGAQGDASVPDSDAMPPWHDARSGQRWIPCAASPSTTSPVGRTCEVASDCADLADGECTVLNRGLQDELKFCTRQCSADSDCGPGASCQAIWCVGRSICMPNGCCMGSSDCADTHVCDVSLPGGLCRDGPCCSEPGGAFACRQICNPLDPGVCPADQPNCRSIEIAIEDTMLTFTVCMP